MLPDVDTMVYEVIDNSQLPTKTYKIENNRIIGFIDKQEAYIQSVYLLLNTERFDYIIYSWNYGVELADLFGKPIPWVFSELPRRIREALMQDDRIHDVTDIDLSHDGKGSVLLKFSAITTVGVIQSEKVVNIR